jgi:hypothetical protein
MEMAGSQPSSEFQTGPLLEEQTWRHTEMGGQPCYVGFAQLTIAAEDGRSELALAKHAAEVGSVQTMFLQ